MTNPPFRAILSYLVTRRGSQSVRQRSAKSFRPVRLRSTPPFFCPQIPDFSMKSSIFYSPVFPPFLCQNLCRYKKRAPRVERPEVGKNQSSFSELAFSAVSPSPSAVTERGEFDARTISAAACPVARSRTLAYHTFRRPNQHSNPGTGQSAVAVFASTPPPQGEVPPYTFSLIYFDNSTNQCFEANFDCLLC